MTPGDLELLIAELPEVYQPIYGHDRTPSARPAQSARMTAVLDSARLLAAEIGRPLRILDIGSSQGYVSFRLAEAGHRVTGLELLAVNVALSDALVAENPHLAVRFVEGDVGDIDRLVDLDDFDLVVCLSVLHHIAHRDGHTRALEIVSLLSRHIPHGVFEMALASEPLPWAVSLPADPRATLAPFAYIGEIARSETHLSEIHRPVLFCSRSFALLDGELTPILSWTNRSHGSSEGDRVGIMRYYSVPSGIIKIAAMFDDTLPVDSVRALREEVRREAHMLQVLPRVGIAAPSLLEFVEGVHSTTLARTTFPGVGLDQLVGVLNDSERDLITSQILDTLADLEAVSLFHDDLRLWNVIFDRPSGQTHLIDYGSVRAVPTDQMWPHDARFSLLTFINALWGRLSDEAGARLPRNSRVDSAELPLRAAALVASLLVHPDDSRVFRDIRDRWDASSVEEGGSVWPPTPLAWRWLAAVEQQRNGVVEMLHGQRAVATDLAADKACLEADVAQLHAGNETQASHVTDLEARVADLEVHAADLEVHAATLEHAAGELALIRQTVSWRITKPIRAVRSFGRRR